MISAYQKQTRAMLTLLQTLRERILPLGLPLGPNFKLHEGLSASHLYLHASSSCRSTWVHGLDVAGFAASDHKAPAHSIANNLGAKQQQKKSDVREADVWRGKHGVGM